MRCGMYLLNSVPRHGIETRLRREYQAASESLERVIELQAPGQIERALSGYMAAAKALEQFSMPGRLQLVRNNTAGLAGKVKRRDPGAHYSM